MSDLLEYRIFGPPGTGKTTYLTRQVHNAASSHGSREIVVCSFTRAAAAEIAGRNLPLHPQQVGTLHSAAYRALNQPPLAVEHLDDWNSTHDHYPIDGGADTLDDGGAAAGDDGPTSNRRGSALLEQAEALRGRRVPLDRWPTAVARFYQAWDDWKARVGVYDFTDLIDVAHATVDRFPGTPTIGFVDETQDLSPLELALVRKWGAKMRWLLMAGDDDQALYGFKGASSDAFLDPPLPDEQLRFLRQSHRVPVAVHALAEQWVAQLSRRQPKSYEPTDDEGAVARLLDSHYRSPQRVLDDAESEIADGRTVMILAACGYQLAATIKELRRRGLPYHNPYRTKRGDWNPLAGRADATTAADRIVALLACNNDTWGAERARDMWTGDDVRAWIDLLASKGVLVRGAKKHAAELPADEHVDPAALSRMFADPADWATPLDGTAGEALDWLEERLLASRRRTVEYPLQVARARGAAELAEEPRCVVGTIHSVKGGEADTVYVYPDLSTAALRAAGGWRTSPHPRRDPIIRQFYVAATRARRRLVVTDPASPQPAPLARFASGQGRYVREIRPRSIR